MFILQPQFPYRSENTSNAINNIAVSIVLVSTSHRYGAWHILVHAIQNCIVHSGR